MKAIPDTAHTIEFPEHATPTVRSGSTGSPPKKLDHLMRRVPTCVIACMKMCLVRSPKERVTIPELLEQEWLGMKDGALPKSPRYALFLRLYSDLMVVCLRGIRRVTSA